MNNKTHQLCLAFHKCICICLMEAWSGQFEAEWDMFTFWGTCLQLQKSQAVQNTGGGHTTKKKDRERAGEQSFLLLIWCQMLRAWLTFQHWSNCVPMFVFITPLLLASVAGMLHADWHLSRHAKRVQMLSNARLWRPPAWVAFIRALLL